MVALVDRSSFSQLIITLAPFRPFGFYALLIVFRIGGGFASSERTILVALKDDRGHRGAQKVRTIPTAV